MENSKLTTLRLVEGIRDMLENNPVTIKVNYPVTVNNLDRYYPRFIIKKIDDDNDIIVGTTLKDKKVLINPNFVVSVEEYLDPSKNISF
ncbi:hypothetical protein GBO85_02730 [Pediococcus acidilactici]|uniref:hypothetical protein n=1 Tax=Pediococcus acidilactici TaxID=1254 RepID=UPI00132F99D2|nr:hypothetical protein [Pediococcus acidilactici]KAF0428296.1 hypothetical protein GBO85_02730 [Pediococcus acidilactici]MCT3040625.1 hypothetical protein [Pediococcus acidilactici]